MLLTALLKVNICRCCVYDIQIYKKIVKPISWIVFNKSKKDSSKLTNID